MRSILIECGKLFDGLNDTLEDNMEILVQGNRIVEVGKHVNRPADTEVIDLSETTVTPGMIDAHMHMSFFDWHDVGSDPIQFSNTMRCLAVAECAKKTLHNGFTTVRHVGWYREDGALDVKRAINNGWIEGSRLIVAPHMVCTLGSHGDSTQRIAWVNPKLADFLVSEYPTIGSGADFFKYAVRREIKMGADFIKVMATGGFYSPNGGPEDSQISDEEFSAIINTAHAAHKTVTAHVYTPELAARLINLGIDGLEHASFMDEPTARLFEEKNIYLVSTFTPFDDIIYGDMESLSQKPIEFQNKLKQYKDRFIEGRKVILNSKIRIGYGTDIVVIWNNYESGREYFSLFRAGMEPFRILKAATSVNAEILGLPDIGSIQPGKLADIAAWNRDLLSDPTALMDCAFVMKDGKQYKAERNYT